MPRINRQLINFNTNLLKQNFKCAKYQFDRSPEVYGCSCKNDSVTVGIFKKSFDRFKHRNSKLRFGNIKKYIYY